MIWRDRSNAGAGKCQGRELGDVEIISAPQINIAVVDTVFTDAVLTVN